jgi:maltooligosyltrehalose synthase
LLLGPIFASSSHGYDTVDYFQIDPRLGDDADFEGLVAACRDRVYGCCSTVSSTMWAGASRRSRRHWPKDWATGVFAPAALGTPV